MTILADPVFFEYFLCGEQKMIISITPDSHTTIRGIALKDTADKTGTPIKISGYESLTIIEDNGKISIAGDSHNTFAAISIRREDTGSEIIIKSLEKKDFYFADSAIPSAEKQLIYDNVDKIKDKLIEVNNFIHDNPETGHQEFEACELLVNMLKEYRFNVEHPVAGLNTAFTGTFINKNNTGPTIGILAEYDALEGLGHGCGHNIIAASAIGSAIALSKSLNTLAATIKIFGTPAEETDGGKIIMADQGLFDDCDVILMCHPSDFTTAGVKYLAMQDFKFTYTGKSAHAAKAYNGKSALSSVTNFFNGTDSYRQFITSDVRLHGIITAGGDAPNVVPEKAEVLFSARANNSERLKKVVERLFNIARGAALMSDTELEIESGPVYESNIVIPKLANLLLNNAKLVGVERIQEPSEAGSTDFGNVSTRVPAECLDIEFVPLGTPCHSHAWVDAGNKEIGHNAVLNSAKIVAATAFDLIQDRVLLQEIKTEFQAIKKSL